jgi:hypothetical protein
MTKKGNDSLKDFLWIVLEWQTTWFWTSVTTHSVSNSKKLWNTYVPVNITLLEITNFVQWFFSWESCSSSGYQFIKSYSGWNFISGFTRASQWATTLRHSSYVLEDQRIRLLFLTGTKIFQFPTAYILTLGSTKPLIHHIRVVKTVEVWSWTLTLALIQCRSYGCIKLYLYSDLKLYCVVPN